jgi:hypothetical protein
MPAIVLTTLKIPGCLEALESVMQSDGEEATAPDSRVLDIPGIPIIYFHITTHPTQPQSKSMGQKLICEGIALCSSS